MIAKKTGTLALGVLLTVALPSVANDELDIQGILAVAKMAGACGILDSAIHLQKTTQIAGGDTFVTRLWSVEAARLGLTVEQLSERCTDAIAAYNRMWNWTEK